MSILWKEIFFDKFIDPCHFLVNIEIQLLMKVIITSHRKKSFYSICIWQIFFYDCHEFFKKVVNKKIDKVIFDFVLKTNDEHISVNYACFRFIESYRFLSSNLDKIFNTLDNDDFEILEKEFSGNWENLSKKLAYPI